MSLESILLDLFEFESIFVAISFVNPLAESSDSLSDVVGVKSEIVV